VTIPKLEPDRLLDAAHVAQRTLAPAIERDWSVPATGLEWSCRTTLDHMVSAPLFHATNLALRSAQVQRGVRSGYPSATNADLVRVLEYPAAILAQVVEAAPPEARGAHPAGMADAQGFVALSCDELLVHTYDIASALGLAYEPPPLELAKLVLRRLSHGHRPPRRSGRRCCGRPAAANCPATARIHLTGWPTARRWPSGTATPSPADRALEQSITPSPEAA
jgi:hypothetical protein